MVTLDSARTMIEPRLEPLYWILEDANWNISNHEMENVLDHLFAKEDVFFVPERDPNKDHRFVTGGSSYGDEIELELSRKNGISNYMGKYREHFYSFSENRFLSELTVVLSHELKHREQRQDGRYKGGTWATMQEYLSTDSELEAYAFDAAVSKHIGVRSSSFLFYNSMFSRSHSTMRKFIKLYNGFLQ